MRTAPRLPRPMRGICGEIRVDESNEEAGRARRGRERESTMVKTGEIAYQYAIDGREESSSCQPVR